MSASVLFLLMLKHLQNSYSFSSSFTSIASTSLDVIMKITILICYQQLGKVQNLPELKALETVVAMKLLTGS